MRPSWDDTWLNVAIVMSKRSKCVRDQVGAVIVDVNNRIVSTGYNGPPAGFKAFDFEGDDMSHMPCSAWCPRASTNIATLLDSTYRDCPSLHAEANALSVCDRSVREGGTIYVTSSICYGCAKLIANSGLGAVVARNFTAQGKLITHRNSDQSYELLRSCGLQVRFADGDREI